MVQLYLVRHGEAQAEGDDLKRTLTDRGRQEVEAIARWASEAAVRPSEIRHSGKTRARETADILRSYLGVPSTQLTGIAPNDDVRAIAEALKDRVMLVSHLPFLSRLASLLVLDDPERTIIAFQTGGMACLQQTDAGWQLLWVMTPSLVP